MLLDKEKKIIPHLITQTPTTKDDLLPWAQDMSTAINTLNRLIVDQFNAHTVNPYAHYSSWKPSRSNRNPFFNTSNAGTSITFSASTKKPIILITGETRQVTQPKGYQAITTTSNITCNLANTGINGIDTGAIAANKVYYFYAVVNGAEVGIIASLNDPSTGPTGYNYGEWMYQGAASTYSGAANFPMFSSSVGVCIYAHPIKTQNHTGTTTHTAYTFAGLPLTAKFGYFSINVTGVLNATGSLSGSSTSAQYTLFQNIPVAASKNYCGPSMIPLIEAQKIYAKLSNAGVSMDIDFLGWQEDTTESP